ncbi:hypothetical protein BDAP_000720 [Binucleata daphniae]
MLLLIVLVLKLLCIEEHDINDSRKSMDEYTDVRMLMILNYFSNEGCKDLVDRSRKFKLDEFDDKYEILIGIIIEMAQTTKLDVAEIKRMLERLEELRANGSFYVAASFLTNLKKRFEIAGKYDELVAKINEFIAENFEEVDVEFVSAATQYMKDNPSKDTKDLNNQEEEIYNDLDNRWNDLYKEMRKDFDADKSTLIKLNHPFTIPGGRFREAYYWDSYWIMKGQLACNKRDYVLNSLLNFKEMIMNNKCIPNGTRKYYLNRSQPPYFIQMIQDYIEKLDDNEKIKFLVDEHFLDAAKKEYNFWMKYRLTEVKKGNVEYELNQYKIVTDYPRPESLKIDIETFEKYCQVNENAKQIIEKLIKNNYDTKSDAYKELIIFENTFYGNIKAAAESGWDFSSRWFLNHKDLEQCCTNDIVPVCLNAILYKNECILSKFCNLVSEYENAEKYKNKANKRQEAMNDILWEGKTWCDYYIPKQTKKSDNYYFSNIMPMLYEIEIPQETDVTGILAYYKNEIFYQKGGVPASNFNGSHQQWDYPNVWAPHQELIVTFLLENYRSLALHIAQSFYNSVVGNLTKKDENNKKQYFEKYNCKNCTDLGLNGEYLVQEGFGWTNGVIILFILEFRDNLIRKTSFVEACYIIEQILSPIPKVESVNNNSKTNYNENGVVIVDK